MQVPMEITFRDVPRSDHLEKLVRREGAKLDKFFDRIMSVRVAIERPQRHQRAGSPYRIRIQVTVPPGKELVVRREPLDRDMHDELHGLIVDAFKAMRRRLQSQVERMRGETKTHAEARALVTQLVPEEGYGFLKTLDGRDIYFHEAAVVGQEFPRLTIGTQVRFVEQTGRKGPQASTVQIVDKPGVRAEKAAEQRASPARGRRRR